MEAISALSRLHRRINRRDWENVRLVVLNRDQWRCRKCQSPRSLEVDHRQALEHGGSPLDMGNLWVLCKNCHMDKTREERDVPEELQQWRDLLQNRLTE